MLKIISTEAENVRNTHTFQFKYILMLTFIRNLYFYLPFNPLLFLFKVYEDRHLFSFAYKIISYLNIIVFMKFFSPMFSHVHRFLSTVSHLAERLCFQSTIVLFAFCSVGSLTCFLYLFWKEGRLRF